MLVYKITNKINGKIYIGKTINLRKRWNRHCWEAYSKNSNLPFHRAIRAYGKEVFTIDVLWESDFLHKKHLNRVERYFIKKYHANDNEFGYNLTEGGEGTLGHILSDISKRKISDKHKGKILSEQHILKLSASHKGKILSAAQRQKMSLAQIRRYEKTPPYTRQVEYLTGLLITKRKWHYVAKILEKLQNLVSAEFIRITVFTCCIKRLLQHADERLEIVLNKFERPFKSGFAELTLACYKVVRSSDA